MVAECSSAAWPLAALRSLAPSWVLGASIASAGRTSWQLVGLSVMVEEQSRPEIGREPQLLANPKTLLFTFVFKWKTHYLQIIMKEIFHYRNASGLVLKLQDIGKIHLYGF